MAAQWCAARDVPVTHAVALNGTPFPVHDDQGIPRDWIAGTLARLSDADLQQFYRLMCGGPKVLKRFLAQAPVRNVDDLRRELVFLKDQPAGPTSVFGHALISTRDRIVPTANQQHCWRAAGVACRDIKGPHFPFYSVAHWEALLDA
jgi:biotin synthesis protein BioG